MDDEKIDEENYCSLVTKISVLYNNVIENFHEGEELVYNPKIFSKLTKEEFTEWIIINNPFI